MLLRGRQNTRITLLSEFPMKPPRSLLAALGVIAVSTPRQAHPYEYGDSMHLLNRLHYAGIYVETMNACRRGLLGQFNAKTRVLQVCPAGAASHEQLLETMSHEAIHASQACLGAKVGKPYMTLKEATELTEGPVMSQQLAHSVIARLAVKGKIGHVIDVTFGAPAEKKILEAEAYAFDDDPWIAIKLLNEACFNTPSQIPSSPPTGV